MKKLRSILQKIFIFPRKITLLDKPEVMLIRERVELIVSLAQYVLDELATVDAIIDAAPQEKTASGTALL